MALSFLLTNNIMKSKKEQDISQTLWVQQNSLFNHDSNGKDAELVGWSML